jgi:hypothetical protein
MAGPSLTVNERCTVLLCVVVGSLEPFTGVTALARTVLVRKQFGGDAGRVGLVAGRIWTAQRCGPTIEADRGANACDRWGAVSQRDRPVCWWTAGMLADRSGRARSGRILHDGR